MHLPDTLNFTALTSKANSRDFFFNVKTVDGK